MSHYKPYPAYKDSGVEWLGAVPEHWPVKKLRFSADINPSVKKEILADQSIEVSFLPMESIGENGSLNLEQTRPVAAVRNGYSYFENGDIAFAKVTPCFENGKGALLHSLVGAVGFGTTELTVLRPKVGVDARFLSYIVRSDRFRAFGAGAMTGAGGLKRVPDEFTRNFEMVWPDIAEQQVIATHLDHETARIDALIEKKTRFIELLREKRQALITHAVTKGLDPNVKTKDSGVDWLGEVPEHWVICNVQHVISKIEQGWSPDCLNTPAEDGQWGVVKSGCVNGGSFTPEENKALPPHLSPMPEYEIKVGDVLMSRASGSPELIGSIALVKDTPEKLMLSDKIFRINCSENMLSRFFTMVMGSRMVRAQVEQSISGADGLANNLPQSRIKKFVLPCPPVKEQCEIALFTEVQINRLQGLREKTVHSITLLKERRSALITAAVTGQIDLREAV